MAAETLNDVQRAAAEKISASVVSTIEEILKKAESPADSPKTEPAFDLAAALKDAPAGTEVKNGDWSFTKPAAKKSSSKKGSEAEAGVKAASDEDDDDDPFAEAGAKLLSTLENPLNGVALPGKIGLGAVGVGGIAGFGGSEIINGLISPTKADGSVNYSNTMSQAGLAAAFLLFGPKLMSRNATLIAAAVPASRAIADVLPLDRWVQWILNRFTNNGTPAAQAQNNRAVQQLLNQVNARQAQPANMRTMAAYDGIAGVYN